jgi:hypothetical protein
LKLTLACVAEKGGFFRDLCTDPSRGTSLRAEKTCSTFLFINPEIRIPGECVFGTNFNTFFRLTGNTEKDLLLFGPIRMDTNS